MKHLKSLRFAVQLLVLLLLVSSLSAATVTTKYVILFDVDNSSATGCTYTVGTTSIAGIEHVLTTTVDRNGSTATVSKVERQQCSGGAFTAPITVDSTGWPATIGSDGALHVVTHIPNSVFGTIVPNNMRLYIGVLEGAGATFIETAPNGTPILYPTIGPRHRAVSHDGIPTEPMSPILDGTFAFFGGLPPMFLGPPVVTGTTQQLINSVFGYSGSTDLYFLFNIGGSVTGSLVAVDDSYTLQQGHGIGAGAPGVLTNDVNTTGSPMLAQLLTTTHLGTITLNADGSFHYNNNGSGLPVDSFTYKATAGGQTSDPATVTFHITPDNAPVGVTDSYTVAHAGTLNVPPPGVLLNDTDADHDPMTAVINTPPLHASNFHLNSDGSFTYTHDGSNTLADTFTYRATDGIIPSFPVTVHITIGADQPPVGVADAYTTAEGSTLTVPAASGLLVNDTDVDTPHASLTASLGTAPAHGSVVINPDGSFVYTHDGSETTSDTFTYIVTDGITPAAPTTVTITITPVNDPPVLNNQTITLLEDTPTPINVTATDAEGDPLTYQLLHAPSHGSLSGTLPNVTYTPTANYNGTDSFVVVASDGKAQSSAATISLTITPVDDAPVAVNDVYAATPNATLTISAIVGVLANDYDVDGDTMQAVLGTGPAHASSFTLNPDGSFSYTPNNGYTGTDTFTYRAQETTGGSLQSNLATVTFNIHGTNQAPVANNQTVSTNEDTPLGIVLTGSDPDGDAITFSANAPAHGVLTGTAPNLTYTPNANYNGTDSFTFTVSDGSLTGNGTITINIAPVNDAPVASPDVYGTLKNTTLNVSAANGVLLNDSDVDGNTLTAVLDVNVAHGTLNLNSDGSFTYTPTTNFAGTDSFTYHAFDGSLASGIVTVTLNVKNTNTPPTANSQTVTTNEDTAVAITLTGSDPDADPLSYAIATPPAHGTLSGAPPSVLYTPAANYSGSDSFTFTVSDGIATSAAATVSITINHVNHAPVATNDSFSTGEDSAVSGNVLTNDSDQDGDTIHAVLVGNVSNGTLNLNSDGSFTYTPNANFNGIDGFTYTANDASLASTVAHVTINVGSVNDVPTFTAGAGVTVLDTDGAYSSGWASSVSAGPADEAWQALNFIVSNDNNSLFSAQPAISPSGVLTFTTITGQSGVANVTVQLHDNGGTANGGVDTTTAMTFTITVDKIPVITSANNTTFLVGTFGTFTTTASAHPPADFFESGALPTGVTFVNNGPPSSSSGTLSGTPAVGTGGVYSISFTATNVRGSSAPQAFTLTVNETPTIGTNPSSQAVCAGATATFTASAATGYPVPTVQWQISTDGGTTYNNIGGATSTTYSFATVAADDGHKFRAVFTNGSGTATTTAATLTVNTVPVVTTNPVTQLVCAGTIVNFTAAASGQPAPAVQWQVSTDGGATFNDIGGATSTTLSFTAAAADTGKQYRARFTNVCGSNVATTAATLTVDTAAVVTTNPVTQTICAGSPVTFTAAATSNASDHTVQWQVSTDGGTTWNNIGGATSTTLSFTTATGDNGKQYRAVFTDACGNTPTSAATLTVDTLPVVTTNPATQTLCAGATATFTAAATSNASDHTVQWQVSTDGGTTFNNIGGATSTTLSFTTAAADNGKQYRAVFTDACGTATTNVAILTVDTLPVVTTNPLTQTLCAGATVTFTAAATSNASDHTVQWQVSTDGGTTWNNVGGATTTTLSFATATGDNGKQYRAVFTDACGSTPTSAATLTVDTLPVVTTNPLTQTVCAAGTASFTAAATSNASDHTVQWQVSTDGGTTFNDIGGATSTTYSFPTVAGDNGKQYRAVFTDACGSTNTSAATLTVDTLPVVTTNPATQTICSGATVIFSAAATSNASDHTVQWQVSTDGGATWNDIGGATSTTLSFATTNADNTKQYRAVFTDACGSVPTSAALLTVDTLPVVTTDPVNQTICSGSPVTFTAAATSNAGDQTVQWQVSTDSGATWNNIGGATSTTLSFTPANGDTGKQYRAVFTSACGSTPTAAATLRVDTLPVVTVNPNTQTICAGSTVSFSATATSNASDHTVQWQVSTNGGSTWTNIGGATSTTLSFSTVAGDNTKQYRAVFTDVCGSTNTTAATLTVDTLPVVTVQPSDQVVCNGATATYSAAATSNASDHTVQWQVSTDGGTTFNNIGGATSTTLSFTPALSDNGNYYRAVFTDACGSVPTAAHSLRVDTIPVVNLQPGSTTVCAGALAGFSVSATSNAGQTVQWQISTDGGTTFTDIPSQTALNYSFTSAASDNGHKFRAVFSNSCGTTTTNVATLTVDTLPVVTTNPLTQTVCAGASATFTAAATSNASDHTVQWQVSTDGGATFNNIGGATSTTLSFATAPGDNTKQYRAVFTDACGSTPTSAATLTVDTLPVVTTNPVTQTLCAGATVNFTAAATSNASDHTVQWQVSTDGGTTFNNIGGATSTTLSFATVAGDNGHKFRAVFTDACGSSNTTAATLTIDTLPVVSAQPSNTTVCSGSLASFTSTATSNASDHTVQWQISIDGGTTFNNIPAATSTTYSFTTASDGSDSGHQYRAVFTDACGSTTSNAATLTVNVAPAITGTPSSTTVCAGSLASFTASASGSPSPTVQWQVSTDGGTTFNNIVGATSTTYSFSATAADTGKQYRAVFTNVCNTATTSAATLTVNTAPSVTTQPTNQSVVSGSTASFTAAASGTPSPTVQWQLSTDGGTTFNDIGGATSTTYTTPATALSDSGKKYRAVFTNSCGTATSNVATLTVTCPTITVTRTGGGTTMTQGTYNTAGYSDSVGATGGTGPYTYAIQTGALPAGLSLSSAGAITGTPTATGTFTFTIRATDTATNCTGDTATLTLKVGPKVVTETYSSAPGNAGSTDSVGNTQAVAAGFSTPTTPYVSYTNGALFGDTSDAAMTVTTASATNAAGTITFNTSGGWSYAPTAGFTGTASFNYNVTSNGVSTQSTINIVVTNKVWYVDNSGSNGNGTSTSPFNVLTGATSAASASGTGDIIYVSTGAATYNTATATTGLTLKTNQQLIGAGFALVVNGNTLAAAGTKPTISNTTATSDAITLADGNTIEGVTVSGATRDGIAGNTHAGFTANTITVQTNTGSGIDLVSMTGTVTITNSNLSTASSTALTINNGTATVTVDNTNTINGGTGTAVTVSNRASANPIAIGAGITAGRIQWLSNTAGTTSFTGSQTLSNATADAITATTNAGATLTFSGTLNITSTSTGNGIVASGGGTLNVSGTANITTAAASTAGLSLSGMTIGVSGVTFTSINTTGAATGISLAGFTAAGTVTVNGGTITNGAGTTGISLQGTNTSLSLAGVTITGGSGATVGITAATNFGTLTIGSSVNVNAATALNLTSGTLTGTFANVTATAGGVRFNGVTFSGTTGATAGTITGAAGNPAFSLTGGSGTLTWGPAISQSLANTAVTVSSSAASVTFSGNLTAGGTSTGVSISGSSGSYNFSGTTNGITGSGGAVTISGETGSGTITFSAGTTVNPSGAVAALTLTNNSNTTAVNFNGSITQGQTANAVTVSTTDAATLTFAGNITSNGTSTGINIAGSSGTYKFNGTNAFSGTTGITIGAGGESGTIIFSTNTTNTVSGTGFLVDGTTGNVTAAITYSGTITKASTGILISVNKLINPGTLTMTHSPAATGNLTQSGAGANSGISITNSTSTNITIANASVTANNTSPAFTGSGNTGATINLQGSVFTANGNKAGMLISGGGTINMTDGASTSSVNAGGGTARAIDGATANYTGTLNLTNVAITGNAAGGVFVTGGGTAVLGGTGSSISGSGPGLTLNGVALTNGAGMTSIGSTGGANGISLTSVTGGTYTVSGGTITGNSGSSFLVSGGTATFTYNGTLAQSNAQRIVNISGITGGTLTFGSTITGTTSCTGITAGGSAGTVTMTGVISLNGAADSFTASGSGTFTIVASNTANTIGSTTNVNPGPAVSISSATIGASGVKFQSIKSSAGVNGILLSNTGTSGSFSLLANGGTCSTSANCTGGFITNATGAGISMTNTLSPSFDRIFIQNTAKSGVSGTQVQNVTLTNSTIDTSGTDHVTPTDNSNVSFGFGSVGTEKNVYGTVIITGNTLTNSWQHGVFIQNFDGNINDAQIQNNTITSSTVIANSNGSGIQLLGNGSASTVSGVTKAEITGNTINNFPSGAGITAQFGNPNGSNGTWGTPGSANVILIQSNKITGDSTNKMNTNAILATMTGNGNAYWKIDSNGTVANPITNMKGAAIGVTTRATSAVTSNTQADISNNVIVANNVLGSQGIAVGITNVAGTTSDAPQLSANITNNTVGSTSGIGIDALSNACSGLLKVKIQNNTVTAPTQASTFAIEPRQGSTAAGGAPTLCLNISGNTATGNAVNGIGIRKQSGQTWAFGVDSLPGADTASPAFEGYINGLNPSGGGTTLISATTGFSTCSNP